MRGFSKPDDKFIFLTYKEDKSPELEGHVLKWDFLNNDNNYPKTMGQFFVYEIYQDLMFNPNPKYSSKITYPKLGVYLNSIPADQTIELEWVDVRRSFENRIEYDYDLENSKLKIVEKGDGNLLSSLPTEIRRMPLWIDMMLVYGVWDHKPNWKELKVAYKNTWWFRKTKSEIRDLNIKTIINQIS